MIDAVAGAFPRDLVIFAQDRRQLQLLEMMSQQNQDGQGQGMPLPGSAMNQQGRDPLGRKSGQLGAEFDDSVKVPDQIDIQRAREVLDELRRRLGDPTRPVIELDYLERLIRSY